MLVKTTTIDGLRYKIGLHDLPFVFLNNDWVKSDKSVDEIVLQIKMHPDRSIYTDRRVS